MKIAFIPSSRIHDVNALRKQILTKEIHQYSHASTEQSSILIGIFDNEKIIGYVAINRPNAEGHKTPHIYPSWKSACEIRGLMVSKRYRGRGLGEILMHAALRFAQVSGYKKMIASARDVLTKWYMRFGFVPYTEHAYTIGAQTFIPGFLEVSKIDPIFGSRCSVIWDLPYPMCTPQACTHGNGSTDVPGDDIIRADVLDAPFDPSPAVRQVTIDLFDIRTTPPDTQCLKQAIADVRGISPSNIIVGPGSSAFMYTVFPQWFSGRKSNVLMVTPTYAEYPHIVSRLGCHIDTLPETMDVVHCIKTMGSTYDGIIIVNPNSPSGSYIKTTDLQDALETLDPSTRVWVDETYIDYVGDSLEKFACTSPNVVVCKSMSKCYALSGTRLAYLVGSGVQLESLLIPPWWLSRTALKIGVAAMRPESLEYYAEKIKETITVVDFMVRALRDAGWVIVGNPVASFVTCTPRGDAAKIVERMKKKRIYIRLAPGYPNSVRIAARTMKETKKLLSILFDMDTVECKI